MSTQELLQNLPLSRPSHWRRDFLRRKKRLETELKFARRRTATMIRQWYRTQYFFKVAFKDIKRGTLQNEDGVLGTTFLGIVICFAAVSVAAQVLLSFFETTTTFVDSFGLSIFVASALSVSVFGLCVAWLSAFLLNSISLALMQGLNRTVHKSIRSTLGYGLYFSSRTVAAWVAYLLVMFLPVLALFTVLAALAFTKLISFDQLMLAAPYTIIVAIAWIVVILMQYSLMPFITFYEPEKSFTQAFGRAHALVVGKGRVFTLMLAITALTAIFVTNGLAGVLHDTFNLPYALTMTIGCSLIAIAWTLIMTALLRKRKFARPPKY